MNSGYNSSLAIDRKTETCSITEQDSNTGDYPWWRMELDGFYNISELGITSHTTCLFLIFYKFNSRNNKYKFRYPWNIYFQMVE